MQKSSSKNMIIILVLILAAGAGIYFYMSGTPVDDSGLISEDSGVIGSEEASVAGARVFSLLNQVNSIKIESKFFTSQVYTSLVDHTVPIYEQNVGKANPFFNPNAKPKTPAAPAR